MVRTTAAAAPPAAKSPAAGRPAADPPAADSPAVMRPDHDRTLAGLGIGQVVVWQCAALAAVAGWAGPAWGRWLTLVLLAVVSVAVVGRLRGRWLYVWAEVVLRYRARRRRAGRAAEQAAGRAAEQAAGRATEQAAGRATGPVAEPVAELDIESFVDRVGTRFGMVRDQDGAWTAVLVADPAQQSMICDDPAQAMPLGPLADALADRDIRLAAVQLVSHVMAAPSPWVDPRSSVATSYLEVSRGEVVAGRSVWIALRLDPGRCPGAVAARGGGDQGAHRALASVAARLSATLDQHARVRALGPDEVRVAVAATGGVDRAADVAAHPVERWRQVAGPHRAQVGFRVRSWGRGDPTGLIGRLAAVPSLATTASLLLRPAGHQQVSARMSVRVVSLAADAEAVEVAVHRAAAAAGVRLVRLDGEHAAAVQDVLPTGGAR
jgi:type VII secretion protein EccE